MAIRYCGSTKWTAVLQWAASTAYVVGDLRRQLAAPTVGNERVWRCTTAGTSGAVEPTWVLTKGSTTTDNTAVWTEVTGTSTYAWSAPHARLENMMSWGAAGDDFYVNAAHTQTAAANVVITIPGTAAAPSRLLCVTDGIALTTGAVVAATGNTNTLDIQGSAYVYGMTFRSGTSNNQCYCQFASAGTAVAWLRLEACAIELLGNNNGEIKFGGQTANPMQSTTELINTTLKFSNVNQLVKQWGRVRWSNTASAIHGTTFPTVLFDPVGQAATSGDVIVHGVDLSALGSGKSLVLISTNVSKRYQFINCKLGASVSLTSGSHSGRIGVVVEMVNCDSGSTNYRYQRTCYQATETQETTIVRASGASDGTTAFARKIITTANAKAISPYESQAMTVWNDMTGAAITVTVPVLTDNVTLTDAEAWIECEYLGDSGSPLGSFASDRISDMIFGTPASQPSDGVSSWTTTGLGTPVKQTLAVSFTPQKKGLIRVTMMLARASTTLYYDPLPQIT